MDAQMLHGRTIETEIASELHIQKCERQRDCPPRSSKSPLAIFQNAEQQQTANRLRHGSFPAVRLDSTRESQVGSGPGAIFGFLPEILWTGVFRFAK